MGHGESLKPFFLWGWPSRRSPFNRLSEYGVGKHTWERQAHPTSEVSREIQTLQPLIYDTPKRKLRVKLIKRKYIPP